MPSTLVPPPLPPKHTRCIPQAQTPIHTPEPKLYRTSCVCVSHLEEESITHRVAEAEDKVLLGVFGDGLHDAVFHPQCMFGNAGVVDPRTAVGLVQEERAPFKKVRGNKET